MNFASPNWAYLLFVLPFLALLKIWADARAQRAMTAFASSERLRGLLLGGASAIWSSLHFGLQLLGLGFLIIALTRPQLGQEEKTLEQTGRNIFIAVDTSKSMLADDVAPNRLTRAKLAAQDLLEKLPGDRVGIIAFAGRAFLQAPLTTDHEAVIESLQSLDHTTIPRGGSSLAAAIELVLQTVAKMPGRQHGLILFTDGQETDEAMMDAAKAAAEKNLLILPVGVGTPDGALIPDPDPKNQGDWIRDDSGNVIKSRLEAAALQELARLSGGEYVELNSQALTQTLVNRLLSKLDRHQAESRQLSRPIERYQWPLFLGIVCIAMSLIMRPSSRRLVRTAPLPVDPQATVHQPPPVSPPRFRPAAAALVACLCGLAVHSDAAGIPDLLHAQKAYQQGRYDQARDCYRRMANDKEAPPVSRHELDYGLGASTLRLKDYETAERAFSDALQSADTDLQRRAQRGLATALYDHGDAIMAKQPELTIKKWTDSRDHFDSALKITAKDTPEFAEIKENRDFVQKRLDELKQQQEQKGKDKQKQQGKGQGQQQPQDQGGAEPQDQEQQGDDKGDEKKTDAMQKDQGTLPEGQLRAGESGKPDEKEQRVAQGPEDDKRNEQTGFTPQEARSQLRNYADDQKSVQYLMRKEQPERGKDY